MNEFFSLISKALSKSLPIKMPLKLPAPTAKLGTKATTNVLGRFLGRWIPLVGWGLLSYDITTIGMCTNRCKNEGSCK